MELIRSYSFHQRRPSPISRWVGSCINRFEACSAFTHGTACTLAESPSDPFQRKLRQRRCLRRRFDCYRVERTSSRAGLAPAEVQRRFMAHVIWRFIASHPTQGPLPPIPNTKTAAARRLCWEAARTLLNWQTIAWVIRHDPMPVLGFLLVGASAVLSFLLHRKLQAAGERNLIFLAGMLPSCH